MTYAISTAIYTAIILLASALLALGWRAWQNHLEIIRLKRNGYRKLAFRRQSERGSIDFDIIRGLAELLVLLLMLGAVLGWLAHSTPQ